MTFNPKKALCNRDEKTRKVWKAVEDERGLGLRLLVCSVQCPAMKQAAAALNADDKAALTDDANASFIRLVAEHVLHDWEGMELEEGVVEKFSTKRAIELMEEYSEIAEWTIAAANSITAEEAKRAGETAKN